MTGFIKAFFIGFIILSAYPAIAQEEADSGIAPAGTIIEIEGAASITRQGQAVAVELDAPVYLDDVIETGAESKAHILLIDDTEITLGENARFSVDEYVFDPDDNSASKGRFSFLRGPFLFTSGLINKTEKPDVELSTAYGSIGIRGTTVWGGTVDGEYGVFLQEGLAQFRTGRAQVNLTPGQGTFIRNNMPSSPKNWGEEKINRAVSTIALQRSDEVRQRVTARKERHDLMRAHYRDAMQNRKLRLQEKLHDLSPEQREQLKEKLQNLSPEQKEQLRDKLQEMPAEKRGELQEKLREMPPEQRQELKAGIQEQAPERKEQFRNKLQQRKTKQRQ